MRNVWPDINLLDIETPSSKLRKLGSFLEEKTDDVVSCSVIDLKNKKPTQFSDSEFVYGFYIKCNIFDYLFRVFLFAHNITLYPVDIRLDNDVANELQETLFITATNEEEFENHVSKIVNTNKVKKVIEGIITMAEE